MAGKGFRYKLIRRYHATCTTAFMLIMLTLFISLLCVGLSGAYDIESGEITLIRPDSPYIDENYIPPEYVSIEDLVFYTCTRDKDLVVKSSVLCLDDLSFKDIETYKWGNSENCYIASYDLEQRDCENAEIVSEYVKNGEIVEISQPLKINRYSSILDDILNKQYSDGGWRTAADTAAAIWVLSNYSTIFADEIDMAVEWLKRNRENEYKCWPNDECSVYETAKVMSYLAMSNINDSSRVIYDGLTFLRKWQNFYKVDELWNLSIKPFEAGTTNCIISYEHSHLNNQEFDIMSNETETYEISAYPLGELILICDQNFYANMTTSDNDMVFEYEGDNLTFTLPYPCWPVDEKWGACDLRTSEYAMMAPLPEDNFDAGILYLGSELRTGRIGEQYIHTEDNITETALYAYISGDEDDEEDEPVVSWLRYRQNNNGSWGNGTIYDMIEPTAYSILGLMKSGISRNNEVIEDAERWVIEQEYSLAANKTSDYLGWNSTEKNALAFIVLKNNAKPLLKFKPMIINVDKESVDIDIYNPTPFPFEEVSYEFSDEIDDHVIVEDEKTMIPAYSYIRIAVNRTTKDTGNLYGYLTIRNSDEEIAKVPVMIVNYAVIRITPKVRSVNVFGTAARLEFDIEKTAHQFSCTVQWDDDDISSKRDISTSSATSPIDISFRTAERLDKTYSGKFICRTGNDEFKIPFDIDLIRYPTFPFGLDTDSVLINESGGDGRFIIRNKLNESIAVDMKFTKEDSLFRLSHSSLVIDPADYANITIFNNANPESNISRSNVIEISALGEKKTINLNVQIKGVPAKKKSPILMYSVLFFLIAVLAAGGYFGYKYRDQFLGYFKEGEKKENKIKMRIKTLEDKEKKTAIMNMVSILRMLKKDDKEIHDRLIEESFSETEIEDAFREETEEVAKAKVVPEQKAK